jgi:predicted RecA/RadA family phage recombinase
MNPMGTTEKQDESRLQVEFGLVSYNDDVPDTRNLPAVPLKYKSGNTYTTAEPVKKGDKFKIEVTNSSACYTYIFGQETDGSSYVLFPYTPKHSPFCGITGTRLFPKDYSLQADNVGSKDYVAVVVTKKPLDYKALSESISKSRSGSYSAKVAEALGSQIRNDIDFAEKSGNIGFDTRVNPDDRIAFIIEVDKR